MAVPPGPEAPAPEPGRADTQALLARAVEQLAAATRSPRVAAWGPGRTGEPVVLAARIEGAALVSPQLSDWQAACQLSRPVDLGGSGRPEALATLPERAGFTAAAPIRSTGGDAAAVLLLGGPADPAGRVRPRTLAALGAAAERLRGPLALAEADQRLAQLDLEIRRLDRMATLGSLVAEVVHEIRNPLVSVKTFLQLLPERDQDPEFTESFLQVARDELQRIERLLNVVLQHGRPPRAARSEEHAVLAEAFDSLLHLVRFRADEREVRLESELEAELPDLALGADSLRQALLNLAMNAIEATPPQGAVTLRGRMAKGAVEVVVDDEGPGVPEALRAQLLAPFYSTKPERPGGLGLSITARIVTEAGGRLLIEDAPGGGARFRLHLPIRP